MEYDQPLPPGYDCKYDPATNLYFYINYFTKTTSFEDPRIKYREQQLQQRSLNNSINSSDNIAMQPLHGSPYHVYPANNYPTMQAFQGPAIGVHSVSASPLLTNKLQQMEMMTPNMTRPSTPRTNIHVSRNNIQETSFSNGSAPFDTEVTVQKINTMFPTVSETHIRMLLKKYYNREAVVISALQVEKHPITAPGPYSTPPLSARNMQNPDGSGIFQLSNLRSASPIARPPSCASGSYYGSPKIDGYRQSPKPHSSPKMKLRYLKSIYPKAEETLILDVLLNTDNNVQKASELLTASGYEKKDTTIPKMSMRKKDEALNELKNQADKAAKQTYVPPPKAKTVEEKHEMKLKLQQVYNGIPERIILMALESVDYSEDKAIAILNIVVEDDKKDDDLRKANADSPLSVSRDAHPRSTSGPTPGVLGGLSSESGNKLATIVSKTPSPSSTATTPTAGPIPCAPSSALKRLQNRMKIQKTDQQKHLSETLKSQDTVDRKANTSVNMTPTEGSNSSCAVGANKNLLKGPNDDLLLVDYVVWNGANPTLANGASLTKERNNLAKKYMPKGANSELCKGPTLGLAKGSLYSKQLNRSVICT